MSRRAPTRKPAGSGRKPGGKNKIPPTLKAVLDFYGTQPGGIAVVAQAFERGLRAKPPFSSPYLKMLLDRVMGPVPKVPIDPSRQPLVIVLSQPLGQHDPLAQRAAAEPGPIVVDIPRPPEPAKALPAAGTPPDADLQLVP